MPLLGMASPARKKNGDRGSFMGRGNDDMAQGAQEPPLLMTVTIPVCSTGSQVRAASTASHYAMGTLQIGGSIDVFMAAERTHDPNQLSSGQLGLLFVHIACVPGERDV